MLATGPVFFYLPLCGKKFTAHFHNGKMLPGFCQKQSCLKIARIQREALITRIESYMLPRSYIDFNADFGI